MTRIAIYACNPDPSTWIEEEMDGVRMTTKPPMGEPIAVSDESGHFSLVVSLPPGEYMKVIMSDPPTGPDKASGPTETERSE